MSMILDGSNGVTFNDASLQGAAASPYVLKNRIINGAMVIDQRNAGASVSVTAGTVKRSVDMFGADIGAGIDGVFSMQQSTTVPTTGYKNSLALTVTTANTDASSGRYYRFYTGIEGFNVADLNSGSATAATVTLSFWVRSSLTGTYCVGFQNAAFNRSYAANYTINSANTWEQKSITLTLDTTGTWANDNTAGLKIFWDLGSGSSFQQTANTWAASNTWLTSSQTNWINTNGATFYITGVQLEQNTSATPFERRLYNQELANCQRYYQKSYAQGTAPGTNTSTGCVTFREYGTNVFLPNFQRSLIVTMRGSPTITWYTTGGTAGSVTVGVGTNTINTQYDISDASTGWVYINGSVSSGSQIYAQFTASAEL